MNEFFDHEDVRRFFRLAAIVVGILGLFLLIETLNVWKTYRLSSPAYNTISVDGEGESFATPDIATFSFSVSADAAAVADAQDAVTAKTNTIVAALKNLGIDSSDIQTTDYSVYPKYTYTSSICPANATYCPPSRQVPDGYTVTNTLTVKVRKTDNAGKALAAAGQNGATNISSLSFTVDDPSTIEADARAKAITDAKTKAQMLAQNLGVSLIRVISFSDNTSGNTPVPLYTEAIGSAAPKVASSPTLQPGQNKVTDTVTVTYEIR